MKPIVLEKDKDGNLILTVDEIKKMVEEAYEDGYEDGRKATPITTSLTWPVNAPWPYTPNWTDRDHITITCETLPAHL